MDEAGRTRKARRCGADPINDKLESLGKAERQE